MIIKNTNGKGLKALIDTVKTLASKDVCVGVPASKNKQVGDGGINMATLAAVHEFGANINHGGGTRYQKGANGNLAKFVSNSFVGPTSGVTGAHTISIPERSYLRASLIEKHQKIADNIADGINFYVKNKKPIDDKFFQKLGNEAMIIVRDYMITGDFAALAPATIKRKRSSKPLVDTGALRQSISYEIK